MKGERSYLNYFSDAQRDQVTIYQRALLESILHDQNFLALIKKWYWWRCRIKRDGFSAAGLEMDPVTRTFITLTGMAGGFVALLAFRLAGG